jgi:hypothetical protein
LKVVDYSPGDSDREGAFAFEFQVFAKRTDVAVTVGVPAIILNRVTVGVPAIILNRVTVGVPAIILNRVTVGVPAIILNRK